MWVSRVAVSVLAKFAARAVNLNLRHKMTGMPWQERGAGAAARARDAGGPTGHLRCVRCSIRAVHDDASSGVTFVATLHLEVLQTGLCAFTGARIEPAAVIRSIRL